MENRAFAFAAGLFTLVLGSAVVFVAMWFTGETEARSNYWLESRYPVTGLNVQAPVRFRGVEIGKVEQIGFSAKDPRSILIRIAVRADTPITRGTYAQLGSQGVTGLTYVMLDDDLANTQRLAPTDETRIPVRQSFFDELSGAGKDLVSDVNQVAHRLNALLDEKNQAQLLRTLASLESATRQITALAVKLEPGVKNMAPLTEDARKAVARAEAMFEAMNQLALELAQRADALERLAKSAEQVGGAARSTSDAALAGTLPRINALVDELSRTSRNLDRLVTELNEHPASLVFGRPQTAPGPGEPGFSPQRGGAK